MKKDSKFKKLISDERTSEYMFYEDTPRRFLERKIKDIYGPNSKSMQALDLVCSLMSKENGYVRDDGQSYYNHCIYVAQTILNHGVRDEDIICAALLHDVVEDIEGYTVKTIEMLFNKNVAEMVELVTKRPDRNYKDDPSALKEYLDAIGENMGAAVIKTADRMHNMETLKDKSLKSKFRKVLETEKYYMPRFKEWRKRYPRVEDLFIDARNSIEPLIHEIKGFNRLLNKTIRVLECSEEQINKLKENGIIFELESNNENNEEKQKEKK